MRRPFDPRRARRRAWLTMLACLGAVAAVAVGVWRLGPGTPAYATITQLFQDPQIFRQWLEDHGTLAPVLFIGVQALQVIVSPIPGEVTGFLGGYVFGEWVGLLYSTVGLTAGSLAAFAAGRWLGTGYVRRVVSARTWQRLGFVIEAEGAFLCFLLYLIPGFPKDILCYLFGISPMPFWVFAMASTLGRLPGTWILSAQGARTASGDYVRLLLLTTIVLAVALPLYRYRARIADWYRGVPRGRRRRAAPRTDVG
jgi:uncharacterized membrane protein YdjX (TVP38/TMEM64 family)